MSSLQQIAYPCTHMGHREFLQSFFKDLLDLEYYQKYIRMCVYIVKPYKWDHQWDQSKRSSVARWS